MPIEKRKDETRDEFVSRCISQEMNSGKPQDQALAICLTYADENFKSATPSVSDATWSTEAPISINLEDLDIYGYKPQHFDMCPGAQATFAHLVEMQVDEETQGMIRSAAQIADSVFRIEKKVLQDKMASRDQLDEATILVDDFKDLMREIDELTGMQHDVQYMNGHIIKIKEYLSLDFAESYNDYPKRATENAKAALRWAAENGWGDCGTAVGKARANQLASGEAISRDTIARMAGFERHRQNSDKELGDGCGRLMWLSWGGDEGVEWAQRKLEQIDKQQNLKKQRKVIFNEDFDEEVVKGYKDLGYKVYVRSARKIKKRDHKVWNKLKTIGLSEDVMVFGEMKDLDKRYNFDLHMTGQDPVLEALKLRGQSIKFKQVLDEYPVKSIEDAIQKESEVLSKIDLKFVTVKVVYQYREIDGIPSAKSGSRDFCKEMMRDTNRTYTLEEIASLPNDHLVEMFAKYDLQPDVFQYRGGFYRLPGTLNTTPFCRHEWRAKVVIV